MNKSRNPIPHLDTRPARRSRGASRKRRKLLALTSLGLAGLVAGLLSGCSGAVQTPGSAAGSNYAAIAGNWRFSSGDDLALAGSVAVAGTEVTARLHVLAGGCQVPTASFAATGSVDSTGMLTLTAAEFPGGGSLLVSGTVAADGRSLVSPTLAVTGSGACARSAEERSPAPRSPRPVSAVQYQAVTGNYSGSFSDTDGDSLAVAASLSQPSTPDANGYYHLTGTATFASVPCIGSTVVTDSTVTGDQISATYTDASSGATITGTGSFSPDAHTLTVTSWTLSGSCGADTGTGTLVHQ